MTYTGFSTRTDEELVRAILDLDDVPSVVRELVYRVECALNALGELDVYPDIAIEDLDELVSLYKDAVRDADTEREKVERLKEQMYKEEQENRHLDAKIEDLEDETKELEEQLEAYKGEAE